LRRRAAGEGRAEGAAGVVNIRSATEESGYPSFPQNIINCTKWESAPVDSSSTNVHYPPPKLQSALSSCSDGRGTLLLSGSGQPSSTLEDLQARKPQECCRPPTSALSSRRRGPDYHGPTNLRKNSSVSSGVSGFFPPDASAFPSCFCGCPTGTFSAATAAVVAWTQVLLSN
jgi:hypothetical protein